MFRVSWPILVNDEQLRYRFPMRVTHVFQLPSGLEFPICPSCKCTLEREYQSYCDRCGQRLGWHRFDKAEVIVWTKPGNSVDDPGEERSAGCKQVI